MVATGGRETFRALAQTSFRAMQRHSQASFSRNRLLSALPPDAFEAIRPKLKRVELEQRHMLELPNEPIPYVYFLEPCIASVVAITPAGEQMEVGLFGPEGMSGLAVAHGTDRSPHQTFIQVAGQALRMESDNFRAALAEIEPFQRLVRLYSFAQSVQVAYTALANGRYTIDERLARWLLMCHDRVDGDVVTITHEFLALMLGVRRAGVTTALHILEGAGVIRASRGRIEVLDRDELRDSAGDSYGAPEAEYERLIGAFERASRRSFPDHAVP
jgi:CRP-like cAMP-binding protein